MSIPTSVAAHPRRSPLALGRIAMSKHVDNFKCWYSDILAGLYTNPHAGFVILMITIPLLERYLREKSGVHEGRSITSPFYDELRRVFPTLPDNTVASQFWQVYRNGLLHQVTLSQRNLKNLRMPDGWVSRGSQVLEIDSSGDFSVHPVEFAKTVIKTIEDDFTTFEGRHSVNHPLPVPHSTGPTGPTGPA